MKRILLASTAIVGFAGAAAADGHAESGISFSGDATLEWNSGGEVFGGGADREANFDWGADLNINFTQVLDNGLVAAIDWEIDFADEDGGNNGLGNADLDASDFVLSLTSDTAGLYFGDTGMAADSKWSAVGDMEGDAFSATDGETVLRGEVSFGDIDTAISYIVDDAGGSNFEDLEQLSIGVAATFGTVDVTFGYQEDATLAGVTGGDFVGDEVIGISASTTLGGADVSFGVARQDNGTTDHTSIGVEVSYPVSDQVTIGAYYVSEDGFKGDDDNYGVSLDYTTDTLTVGVFYNDEQGNDDYGFDIDYDLGNGAMLMAGYGGGDGSDDGYYVGGSYDLGGGAEVRLIHVEADNLNADNEYFGDDDENGTTLSLSFSF